MITCIIEFQCTNNVVEYEVLVQGLKKSINIGVQDIKVYGDSEIIIKQVHNMIHFVSNHLKNFQQLVQYMICKISSFNITPYARVLNVNAYMLENVASRLIPSDDFVPDRFFVEFLF